MKITQMYSITGALEFLFYNKNLKFVNIAPPSPAARFHVLKIY
jgi:hypothetical protein